jgi:hypothetical protein
MKTEQTSARQILRIDDEKAPRPTFANRAPSAGEYVYGEMWIDTSGLKGYLKDKNTGAEYTFDIAPR